MLAYVLALVVGLGSLAIYLAAFFFPEIHRKNDFIWSGVGLFYGLVLWIFAPRITGGLLLGHVASVALLVWFGWQTLSLRRQVLPQAQLTPLPSAEEVGAGLQEKMSNLSLPQRLGQLQNFLNGVFAGVKNWVQQTVGKKPGVTPTDTKKPAVTVIDKTTPEPQPPIPEVEKVGAEAVPPNPPAPELVEAAQEKTEQKPEIPVAEVAPDAVLAPPAEVPVEVSTETEVESQPSTSNLEGARTIEIVSPSTQEPETVEAAQANTEQKPDAVPPAETPTDHKPEG